MTTQQFSTSHASEDFENCDATDFKACILARTRYVAEDDLVDTITRCIQIPEDTTNPNDEDKHEEDNPSSPGLRTIVITGHSPQRDLDIPRRLGLTINRTTPVAARHALSDVLTGLRIPYSWYDLHNAGNDATYTLYALIMMAARWAEHNGRTAVGERLRALVEGEVAAPRWRPVRRALGAHLVEDKGGDTTKRLGSELEAVARSLRLRSKTRRAVKPG